jgi:ABC-2 type transport system ATP-binding protein
LSYPIETYNLTKRFPVIKRYRDLLVHPFRRKEITALHNVNLQVEKGELFGLLGPNGAGKTTLIKTLCTLILPTSGEAFVNGLEVSKNGKRIRKTIGYVIDDERSFYWRLSGKQNLKFFAKLNNIASEEAVKKIDSLLNFMGLAGDADRLFKDYSTGMRQKLAIARGLLTDPEIIFMDEPTNRLDPVAAQNLKTLVKDQLVKEEGKTVILATHNLQDAEEICDRIAIIHNGEIRFSGTVEEVKMQFNQDKIYVMELKGRDDGLLSRINNMSLVKKVVSNSSFSDRIRIEVEIEGGNTNITRVVKEIVDQGGRFLSLHEKESSLRELFSRIMDN